MDGLKNNMDGLKKAVESKIDGMEAGMESKIDDMEAKMETVGLLCFDSLENKKTRKHQNQSLELQDLVLLLSERDLSNCLFIAKVYLVCFEY